MSDATAAMRAARARSARVIPATFVTLVALTLLAYWVAARASSLGPGDPGSRAFGVAALVALLSSSLYALRRRTMRIAPGSVAVWLDAHLYLGAWTCLLVLLHSGLRLPAGFLTWALWLGTLWVTASGVLGRMIQRWIPRALTSGLTTEVLFERIPDLVTDNATRADKVAQGANDDLRRFYRRRVADQLAMPRFRAIFLIDITGGSRSRVEEFRFLANRLDADSRAQLDELEAAYRSKLELDAHYTLQSVLRAWPLTHVPVAVLLVALTVFHVLTILYY